MLLSLTMVLSLLPSTALASAMLASAGGRAGDVVPDGATSDTWTQVGSTKVDGSVDPAVEDGKLVLKAVAGNNNNFDAKPAIFVNQQLNEAVAAAKGEKTLTFTMTPEASEDKEWVGFGFAVHYTNSGSAYYIGYDSVGKWFVQYYGGTNAYPPFTGPDVVPGQAMKFEITWSDEKVSLKIDDVAYELPNEGTLQNVSAANGVAFKAGGYGESYTTLRISDVHYTGQKTVETVLPDGAVADNWQQDAQTVRGTDSICEVTNEGHLHLKTGSGNANNGETWTSGTGPAVFLSEKMIANLEPGEDGKYVVTFKLKALSEKTAFGVYLNYKNPVNGMMLGQNPEEFFWQTYTSAKGGSSPYGGNNSSAVLAQGTTYEIRVSWDPTAETCSYEWKTEEAEDFTALASNQSYSEVVDGENVGLINNFAIKLGKSNAGVLGEVEIWDIHYTGQKEEAAPPVVTTYTVSGVVKCGDNPVSGASVTMNGKTVATDASGAYSFARVEEGSYLVQVSADGYESASENVDVNGTNVTKNFNLTRKTVQSLPTDGVTDDEWVRDEATNEGKTNNTNWICEKINGQVHLKSGSQDGNGHTAGSPSDWPGVFYNKTANEALAAATGNRWIEITYVRAEGSNPRFGFIFNYQDPSDGYFIGSNTESSGWFWENYNSGSYGSGQGSTPAAGAETTIYAEWNDTTLVSFKQDGKVLYSNVAISGAGKGVGLRMNTYGEEGASEVYIKEMHYSGQSTVTAYTVSGTVKGDDGKALADATVSAGGRYATTDAKGEYTLVLPVGEYIITASKEGYETVGENVAVNSAMTKSFTLKRMPVVSGTVSDQNVKIPGATVTLSQSDKVVKTAVTDANGEYTIIGVADGDYTLAVSAAGYTGKTENITVAGTDLTKNFVLEQDFTGIRVLKNSAMKVLVDEDFPRVIQYRMLDAEGHENGIRVDGQKQEIRTININGTAATIDSVNSVLSDDGMTVTYTIVMSAPVAITMTARLTLDNEVNQADSKYANQTLGFYIDEVVYTNNDRLANPVKNIEIPNHSLVSVNSTQPGAKVTGAKANGNTSIKTNDVTYPAEANKTLNGVYRYFAAFISNDIMAAGISSNSSLNGGGAGTASDYNRVTFTSDGENVTIGLDSAPWPYDYLLADSNPGTGLLDHTTALTAEQKVISEDLREQPYAKVVIAVGDQNNDKTVDWQDGAIALRETVMHIPNNSQSVKDRVNTRIALNFGSQAQNPFLTSLDNAKRVALHTDGLGQAILLKGYAGEGHDSNHPDYWNMGTRMGGATDFATMLKEGKTIGAYFGIHVNAGELYAEAEALDDDIVYYRADGRVKWGWHWHDTAISFKTLHDFGTGDRQARFQRLYDEGGAELEFIYVDIWGNCTGGTDDSWQTRMLSNEITKHVGNGQWRIAHEWAWANPYESTFQHWTTDFAYGNYSDKGALNSAVIRFMLNEYKDSFPPDFASYGGACNAPLLGGPAMQGFEGWQGDGEYDLSIYNTYNQMIPTKFLQHYGITNWINADNSVAIPYNGGGAGGARGTTTSNWTPEMQVKLAGGGDEIVVTRGLDSKLDNTVSFSVANEVEYRSRVMTLNGKVVLEGAPASAGEDNTFPHSAATLKYLIPWYWTADGQRVSAAEEKLYHWNAKGGTSTWELPNGWTNLSSVVVYELSDQGRGAAQTVNVVNGRVTLNAKAETGYVVVKGENGAKAPNVTYYADGQHITDPSFNDASLSVWTVNGSVEKVNSINGISVLKQTGEASVSQELVGLKPGVKYLAYVAVENHSNDKAYIEVKDAEGNVLGYNYAGRSIARNYISGDALNNKHGVEVGGSYMQNMYVFFVAPEGDVTLTLGHEGEGYTYFDALRIIETEMDGYTYDADGSVNGLFQDFEHSAQGEWPFVVGGIEGVQDNRQHLSELHAPYTQSGWNIKEVDDVLDGKWSLKTHGLTGNGNLVYQTIPQNFRFEPGKTYVVSFDYQMGCENLMQVVIGDGEWNGVGNCQTIPLEMAKGAGIEGGSGSKTCTFTIIGSESGQTWFGIATAGGSFNNAGLADSDGYALYFSGRGDFILDNLRIGSNDVQKTELNAAVVTANGMNQDNYVVADGYEGTEAEAWNTFSEARTTARSVLNDMEATQEQVDAALAALNSAMANLKKLEVTISGTVTDGTNPVAGAVVTLENVSYMPLGLTATTDSEGRFAFESTSAVELSVDSYKLKVQADGYDVVTVDATALSKTEPDSVTEVVLTAQATGEGIYVNSFDGGNVTMMKPLDGNVGSGSNETIEATEYNGSGAVKITFNSSDRNTVIDEAIRMTNGTFEMDVTALTTGVRVGVTVRAIDMNNRIYFGHYDNLDGWGLNYWNGGADEESYSINVLAGPALNPGVTRRVKVEINDSSITLWVDGVLVGTEKDFSMSNSSVSMPDGEGYVGINVGRNPGNAVIIDNIRVVKDQTHEHVEEIVPAVPATCTESGLTEGVRCALCGKIIVEQETVEALGHDLTHVEAVEPTTETEGNIEYWYCERCGKYFSDEAAEVEITKADTVLDKLSEPGESEVPQLPVVDEIVIPGPGEEIEDPDTPLADLPFIDVAKESWYAQAVANIYAKGYMQGTSELTFDPKMALNRGMMAQIIHNMAKNPSAGADVAFTDLNDRYYTEAVAWGVANGILKGYSEELFGGEDDVTREQMVVMLYRYAQSLELCKDVDLSVLDGYTDSAEISGWAKEAMAWAVENGLIQGRGNNDLDSKANITRAEVAAILDRFSKLFLA